LHAVRTPLQHSLPTRRSSDLLNAIARQSQQALQAASHGEIVVHDEDGWLGLSHAAGAPTSGKMKWKVAPPPALFVAQMTPPCASMIDRAIASPIPMPSRFVVKNGSKICSWESPRSPGPESSTATRKL